MRQAVFGRIFAYVLRDLHGTEVRPTDAAEMRGLRTFGRESFVMELTQVLPALSPSRVCPSMSPPPGSAPFTSGLGIERQITLIFPTISRRFILHAEHFSLTERCVFCWIYMKLSASLWVLENQQLLEARDDRIERSSYGPNVEVVLPSCHVWLHVRGDSV
jgi:hypothetical protein